MSGEPLGSRRAVVLSLASALAGGLLGVALQEAVDASLDLALVTSMVCALVLIAVLTTLTAVMQQLRARADQAGRQHVELQARMEDGRTTVTEQLHALRHELGQTVGYQTIDQLNSIVSTDQDAVSAAIRETRSELLVLDFVDDAGQRPASSMQEGFIAEFLDLVTEQALRHPGFTYQRICQVRHPESRTIPTASPSYLEHCRRICHEREQGRTGFSVQVAAVRYPLKFMLMDRRVLMLQLHRTEPSTGRPSAWCELIFTDASGQLVQAFLDVWRDVSLAPSTRAVTASDVQGFNLPGATAGGATASNATSGDT